MRIETLHPKYLDTQGLVALWREALLARKVLRGRTVGYRAHPQLLRFRAQSAPVACIASYLRGVHEEAQRRGCHFDAARIAQGRAAGPLTETDGQLLYEWQHLLCKLRKKSPERFAQLRDVVRPQPHPMFRIVAGGVRAWERFPASAEKA